MPKRNPKMTKTQCLEYVKASIKAKGYPPTRKEIARRFDVCQTYVQLTLKELEKENLVFIQPNTARAICVL